MENASEYQHSKDGGLLLGVCVENDRMHRDAYIQVQEEQHQLLKRSKNRKKRKITEELRN